MRLLYTPIRGYVHTVEAVVGYAGLRGRIEPVPTRPFGDEASLLAVNPLGKVPALVLDSGEYLGGGPVIYEYLDSLHTRRRLYPARGPRRWTALRQAWMADGLFDTFVLIVVESWLPAASQRPEYVQRCWRKILAILDQLERDAGGYGALDIGQVRTVGALQFLELKLGQVATAAVGLDPGFDPLSGRPALARWYRAASRRKMFHEPLLPQE